jgi:hypothetical protein
MTHTVKKIENGHYEYRGYKIEKLQDYPEYDWRIFDADGEWENTFTTKRDCLNWLDARAKYQDMMSYKVGG